MQQIKNSGGEKMRVPLSKVFCAAAVFVFIFLAVNTKVSAESKLPCDEKILVSLQQILQKKDLKALSQHLADTVVLAGYTEEKPIQRKYFKKEILQALKAKKDNDIKWFFFADLYIEKDEMENTIKVNEEGVCKISNDALRFSVTLELTAKNWLITEKDQY